MQHALCYKIDLIKFLSHLSQRIHTVKHKYIFQSQNIKLIHALYQTTEIILSLIMQKINFMPKFGLARLDMG